MRLYVGVLTDDLSGGLNIGVEFAQAGYRTHVMNEHHTQADADVLIINTDSRDLPAEQAATLNRDAARSLQDHAPRIIVKKIDSLMRGNIGHEVAAIMQALNMDICLLTPASPKLNRRVVGAYVLVNDAPLSEQQQRLDPLQATSTSHISRILSSQTQHEIVHLDIDTIRQGETTITKRLQSIRRGIIVADAISQGDLNQVVRCAHQSGIRFFAGTFGMGEAICQALLSAADNRILVVVGSLSEAAHRQALFLQDQLPCAVIRPDYTDDFFTQSPESFAAPYAQALHEQSRTHAVSIVHSAVTPDALKALQREGEQHGIGPAGLRTRINSMLQALISPYLDRYAGYVATGGATAMHLLALLQADGLTLEGVEVIPGVPFACISGGPFAGLPFIVKPGSQGADDALYRLTLAAQQHVEYER